MGLPPFEAGGVKFNTARALPAVAVTPVGAPGSVAGLTGFEGVEVGPVPTALVALTVKMYVLPLVSPVTVIGLAVTVWVMAPG